MHSAYLSLGSNIQPGENIPKALELLARQLELAQVSSAWCTAPVGTPGPSFINLAVHVFTDLECSDLKTKVLQKIEADLGRVRTVDKFAPRTIDIDIILYDEELIDKELEGTAYLILPLAELIPAYISPGQSLSLQEMADRPAVKKTAVKMDQFPEK